MVIAAALLNNVAMVWIHDRAPLSVRPLPDPFFVLFPEVPGHYASKHALLCVIKVPSAIRFAEWSLFGLCMTSLLLTFFHAHRWIVVRRVVFVGALCYAARAAAITLLQGVQIPMPSVHTFCAPQESSTSMYSMAWRVWRIFTAFGMELTYAHDLCGDLIISGHTISLVLLWQSMRLYLPSSLRCVCRVSGALVFCSIFAIVLARRHYSLDVVLAYWLTTRILWLYQDFVPLFSSFESIYTRNLYIRIRDVCNRPISSVPGPLMTLMERETSDNCWNFDSPRFTGRQVTVANFGSYNYLGFAETTGACADAAKAALHHGGIAYCSSRQYIGCVSKVAELEALVADFVGTDAAIVFPSGFATNSMNIPSILGSGGSLVLSDELNHASLITGCKLASGAVKRIFRHNDMNDLEQKLKEAIFQGQPNQKKRLPFRNILIIVEGIYSMDGTITNLPAIITLKNKYKAYLWLDEAHSVGALGPQGRGAVDHWRCMPRDVDVIMGTFSKSFGAVGGFVAGSSRLINFLKSTCQGSVYGAAFSPPVTAQIISSMSIIKDSEEGCDRLRRLARNTAYFRSRLRQAGFVIMGAEDSPVIPLMIYSLPGISRFSREMLRRFGVAVVVVGYPATPLTLCRARFCVSAAHTKEMIDQVILAIDELGDEMFLKFSQRQSPISIQY